MPTLAWALFAIDPGTCSRPIARVAWEQPKLFSEEVRAGFRSLR
jgi:hypothetical protein